MRWSSPGKTPVLWSVALAFVAVGLGGLAPSGDASHGAAVVPPCDLDVGLAIDRSGSMGPPATVIVNGQPVPPGGGGPTRMDAAKAGSAAFVDTLSPTLDQSGLVSFSDWATLDQTLTFIHADTNAAIAALNYGGGTNIGAGITISHNDFTANGRPDARWIMVVLSDGDGGSPTGPANLAKADGIEIFAIAIQGTNPATMMEVASDPDSTYFKTAVTPADVEAAFQEIIEEVHQLCADFEFIEVCEGETVEFTDLSRVRPPTNITKSEWYFGTGTPVTYDPWQDKVSYTYPTSGVYDVSLTVYDDEGTHQTKIQEVRVMGCPKADFGCVTMDSPWLRIAFVDSTVDMDANLAYWNWTFGDGGTGTGAAVQHDYKKEGWYDVTLNVTDADGNSDEVTKSCFADLNHPPVIDPVPVQVVYEGQSVSFTVTGYDPDGDPTWFESFLAKAPGRADFDFDTMTFSWKTTKGDAGEYHGLYFEIHDGQFFDAMTTGIIVLPAPEEPAPGQSDADDDGMPDQHDNCPYVSNPGQADVDGDGVGDACQGGVEAAGEKPETGGDPEEPVAPAPVHAEAPDRDRDGVPDAGDNCPATPNAGQGDMDRDLLGDFCDPDLDGDGVAQLDAAGFLLDNCPYAANADQVDTDGDGFGDACDGDRDSDGVLDEVDNCLWIPNALQGDVDGDGVGDACQGVAGEGRMFAPGEVREGRGGLGDDAGIVAASAVGAGMSWLWVLGLFVAAACVAAGTLLVVRQRGGDGKRDPDDPFDRSVIGNR